jgi:hypothetical protein
MVVTRMPPPGSAETSMPAFEPLEVGPEPVAMMTTSAKIGSPFLKESFRFPFHSSIFVIVAPTRSVTPWRSSQPATIRAQASSTMRGRIRGATSTMVSEAPRARMAFRIVNEMKPAPTMTTFVPGWTPAMTARASSSVQKEWTPTSASTGGRAARVSRSR